MTNKSKLKSTVDVKSKNELSNLKNKVSAAQRRANSKYDSKQDKIIVRVPEGKREVIAKYVENHVKDHPEWIALGKASVNAFIRDLISKDIGEDI